MGSQVSQYEHVKFVSGEAWLSEAYNLNQIKLETFCDWFERNGEVIHQDRNILKLFTSRDYPELPVDCVVKSFKTPALVHRLIYSFFRPSKAIRSLRNSINLLDAGFSVPTPVFCIVFRKGILLDKSFYASQLIHFDCTLHEVRRGQMFSWEELLPLVVKQAFDMHQHGIIHRDFSPGNVLVSHTENGYEFSFVDLNRLRYCNVSPELGLKSFIRLVHNLETQQMIANCYAIHCGISNDYAFKVLSHELKKHQLKQSFKKTLKSFFGVKK